MTQRYELKTIQTIQTINQLLDSGTNKISVLLRHSARYFSDDARLEPFMGLTDTGKQFAMDFGALLPPKLSLKLSSSFMGRCIETSYLIDKGFTKKNNLFLEPNCIHETLSPFYIKDIERTIQQIETEGNDTFLRNWFDHCIDDDIIEHPEKTATLLTQFMIEQIKPLKENQIAVCVSHDWNLFPVKEFKLGLKHEEYGNVGYLEGIVFFEKENHYYITNHQAAPQIL